MRTQKAVAAGVLAGVLALIPSPAGSHHRASIGIGRCGGPENRSFQPGNIARVAVCLVAGDRPIANHSLVFFEEGPSPVDTETLLTDANGRAEFVLSSPSAGVSWVGACDDSDCFGPVAVVWSSQGVSAPARRTPPPITVSVGEADLGASRLRYLSLRPQGEGFRCEDGPGNAGSAVPAAISISDFRVEDGDPDAAAPAIILRTGQSPLVGAAAFGVPVIVYVSLRHDDLANDSERPFPYRGYNRLLVFWVKSDLTRGTRELTLSGASWRDVKVSFDVEVEHEQVSFVSRTDPFPSGAGVGTRGATVCDAEGYARAPGGPVAPVGRSRAPASVAAGIALLLIMGALTVAVLRSGQPPGRVSAERPGAPEIAVTRRGIRYDELGRPRSYLETLELPNGARHTIRVNVEQESLVIDTVDFLDSADWDDPSFVVRRGDFERDEGGRPVAFKEETVSSDGVVYRARVSGIRYEPMGRVSGYSRSTTVIMGRLGESKPRLESVSLSHEGPAAGGSPTLSATERMERSEIEYDEDGHIVGYISRVSSDTEASVLRRDSDPPEASVPRAMFESGLGFPRVPVFDSRPLEGWARARGVLTRWFRRHGCRVNVHVEGNDQEVLIKVGERAFRPEAVPKGRIWLLQAGDYPVLADGDLVAWISVQEVPSEVDLTVNLPHPGG